MNVEQSFLGKGHFNFSKTYTSSKIFVKYKNLIFSGQAVF
jgi:hypothetical protein